jgi:hypothetical protein
VLATRKQNWGEDRVMYYGTKGRLCSMLASWTSVSVGDAFGAASAGRSLFRTDDLRQLRALVDELREGASGVK